jgi:uncharacterized protein
VQAAILEEGAVREGHRVLLSTFRELAEAVESAHGELPEPEVLSATVSFLRESLLPFATLEERSLSDSLELREETGFEHAFLAVEIDALDAEVSAVLGSAPLPPFERERAFAAVRRRVHRIGAVLELHVLKAEDRPHETAGMEGAEPDRVPGEAETHTVREMTPARVHAFLGRRDWGVLATQGADFPYAVPVSYGFDGEAVYVATRAGQKARYLGENGAVCLTVLQVEDGARWSSVVVRGSATPVHDLRGKLHAVATLVRQRRGGTPLTAADLARLRGARIFRITPLEVSGRER